MLIPSLVRVQRPFQGLQSFFLPGLQRCDGCSSVAQEIVHTARGILCLLLNRFLPQDVYIRRKNDYAGGQGRICTSNLNFVSAHLSKPGHRCGCCCMSPRCLLRQIVDRCLLSWAFFIEKTGLPCFARFLFKWRETALWMFPDATQPGTSRTFDGFHDDGD